MSTSDIQTVKRFTPGPLPLHAAKEQGDRVEAILAQHQRNGGRDMTVNEVCAAYLAAYPVNEKTGGPTVMHPSTVNARLANLEAAGRVVCDRENKRFCSVVRSIPVKVYCLPLKQAGLI